MTILPAGNLAPQVWAKQNGLVVTAAGPLAVSPVGSGSFSGFSFPAILTFDHCSNCIFDNLIIDAAGQAAIVIGFIGCNNCALTRCKIINVGPSSAAIASVGGTNNVFDANAVNVTAPGCRGMWIGNVNTTELETNPIITRNALVKCGATGIVTVAASPVIRYNESCYTGGSGIALSGEPSPLATTTNAIVELNRCIGNPFHGIQGDSASRKPCLVGATIRSNLLDLNHGFGVYVNSARGWIVKDNAAAGNVGGPHCVTNSSYVTVDDVLVCD